MKHISYFLFACLLCLAACHTEEIHTVAPPGVDEPVKPSDELILIKHEISDGDTSTYSYDAEGKIKTSAYSNGSTHVSTYSPDKVQDVWYDDNGSIVEVNISHLDANGMCIKYSEAQSPRVSEYQYNADGQLIRETVREADGALHSDWFFTYVDGNRVKDSTYRHQQGIWGVYKNEYDKTIRNSIGNEHRGRPYWGRGSKNYLTKRTYTSSVGEHTSYTYLTPVLDAKGRIIERTYVVQQSDSPAYSHTTRYVYY
jgi:YD repeat-containing protein